MQLLAPRESSGEKNVTCTLHIHLTLHCIIYAINWLLIIVVSDGITWIVYPSSQDNQENTEALLHIYMQVPLRRVVKAHVNHTPTCSKEMGPYNTGCALELGKVDVVWSKKCCWFDKIWLL